MKNGKKIIYTIDEHGLYYTDDRDSIIDMVKLAYKEFFDYSEGAFYDFEIEHENDETIKYKLKEKTPYASLGYVFKRKEVYKKTILDNKVTKFNNFGGDIYTIGENELSICSKYVTDVKDIEDLARDFLDENEIDWINLRVKYMEPVAHIEGAYDVSYEYSDSYEEEDYYGDIIEHDSILYDNVMVSILKNFKKVQIKNKSKQFNL